MKKIIYILFFMLCPIITMSGQEKVAQENSREISDPQSYNSRLQDKKTVSGDMMYSNADSSEKGKRKARVQQMRKRMMDNFMDKDGDGINDCRAKGMRWSGKSMGKGEGQGKQMRLGRHGK